MLSTTGWSRARPLSSKFDTNVNTIKIRKATKFDTQSVLDVRNAAIKSQCAGHYPEDVLRTWADVELTEVFSEAVERCCHVALLDGRVVATGMINLESGKLDALFVEPAHMNLGLGKQVLAHLEQLAIEAGLAHLSLDSTLNAAAFYRAQGFIGDLITTYESPRGLSLACVPMIKTLTVQIAAAMTQHSNG